MKKHRIGLAIAENELHLAVVTRKKNHWQLVETLSVPVTTDNIRQMLQQARCGLARSIQCTIIGLPYHQVLMKEIHLDTQLTPADVYQYLQQQLPVLLGKPAQHWFFDFEPMRFSTAVASQTAFRLAAAPQENIATWLQICRAAGLHVQYLDVDVLALARLLPTLTAYHPDQPQALLWLKTSELLFTVSRAGQLIYAKKTIYIKDQPMMQTLTSLLQFFNGLYPHSPPASIILVDENSGHSLENLPVQSAELNSGIWEFGTPVQAQYFCSLGLAIYGH